MPRRKDDCAGCPERTAVAAQVAESGGSADLPRRQRARRDYLRPVDLLKPGTRVLPEGEPTVRLTIDRQRLKAGLPAIRVCTGPGHTTIRYARAVSLLGMSVLIPLGDLLPLETRSAVEIVP